MKKITLDYSKALNFISQEEIEEYEKEVSSCHEMIHGANGLGSKLLGWVNQPRDYDRKEFEKLKKSAEGIRKDSQVFIVIGIGGSYIGARAGIEMLSHTFYNEQAKDQRKGSKVYFLGHNVSASYIKDLIDIIGNQDLSINIISKSGTTLEPSLSFRILKEYMEDRYGREEASRRIYVTTDKDKGPLRDLALKESYQRFTVPDNIGGRYSVLSSVGLLPMAVAGIEVESIMEGAGQALEDLKTSSLKDNPSYQYAVVRNILDSKGKNIEILACYEPSLSYFSEWWKQLFGESEGKNGQGIFPTSLSYTRDLHSMGQYIQDGRRNLFQTIINIKNPIEDIRIESIEGNLDGLNYLEGKTLDFVNTKAMKGSLEAHFQGGVPNILIGVPEISPYYFGYLVYFFMKACAMSGYLQDINPFDQPGVEAYKNNMFGLLSEY